MSLCTLWKWMVLELLALRPLDLFVKMIPFMKQRFTRSIFWKNTSKTELAAV